MKKYSNPKLTIVEKTPGAAKPPFWNIVEEAFGRPMVGIVESRTLTSEDLELDPFLV